MIAVPLETPVTLPDPPIVTFVLAVVQVPPDVKSLREIVAPIHTPAAPPIPDGAGFTVTAAVAMQPAPAV